MCVCGGGGGILSYLGCVWGVYELRYKGGGGGSLGPVYIMGISPLPPH